MSEQGEYVLGVDEGELRRLETQNTAWTEHAFGLWRRAGIRTGDTVLDLGCGPGFTSFDLARVVGPTGRVVARDRSATFLEFLTAERDRRGLSWIEPSRGPVEELDFPADTFDAVYARWLFCWLEDPAAAFARVAATVKPGGAIAIHDYLDWGTMRLLPRSEPFERTVAQCMRSWELSGGNIDVGRELPGIARAAGWTRMDVRPVARIGGVGSHEWRWVGEFMAGYGPKLVAAGLATEDEVRETRADWIAREVEGTSLLYTPVMGELVLRRGS